MGRRCLLGVVVAAAGRQGRRRGANKLDVTRLRGHGIDNDRMGRTLTLVLGLISDLPLRLRREGVLVCWYVLSSYLIVQHALGTGCQIIHT